MSLNSYNTVDTSWKLLELDYKDFRPRFSALVVVLNSTEIYIIGGAANLGRATRQGRGKSLLSDTFRLKTRDEWFILEKVETQNKLKFSVTDGSQTLMNSTNTLVFVAHLQTTRALIELNKNHASIKVIKRLPDREFFLEDQSPFMVPVKPPSVDPEFLTCKLLPLLRAPRMREILLLILALIFLGLLCLTTLRARVLTLLVDFSQSIFKSIFSTFKCNCKFNRP